MNIIHKTFGSGFFTGYIPFASGTFGSLAAFLIYFIPGFEKPVVLIPAILLFSVYGIFLGNKFEKAYGHDPAECTIDEVVGSWISLLFLPKFNIPVIIIAFFLWRAIDIVKPFPVKQAEKLPGGLGIMLDDILGGIYTCLIVNLLVVRFIF